MAPGGGQQGQGQGDTGMDLLWIIVALVMGAVIIWYFFHVAIVTAVLKLKFLEASLIGLFIQQIIPLKNAIGNAAPQTVTVTQLLAVATEVGRYLRYPIGLIFILLAFKIYRTSAATRFCEKFNMKTLLKQELKNWPYANVVTGLNLVKTDIQKGPWAMALTAMQFSKKYKLLDVERKHLGATGLSREMGYEATVNKYRAHKIFVRQLGELWQSFDALTPHRRALFAIFAAKALGDRESADKLLRQIATSAKDPELNLSGADAVLNKHKDDKIILEIINRHAFEYGVLAAMLELARTDGVLASAEFLWLKPRDRVLWYVLNAVGRQTVFPEVAGIFAHFYAEKTIGYKLVSPMVEEAVIGLEDAMSEWVYVPSDEEKAQLNS
ncbi:MAG: type IVB secretion system coupling complex protein DotM/IcmP [Gammaproteobacteria bacterium]|nr:type IVB secretion system coupling complex protein DotM/IcmP [Gammaproteobacteria bacterium]